MGVKGEATELRLLDSRLTLLLTLCLLDGLLGLTRGLGLLGGRDREPEGWLVGRGVVVVCRDD